MGKEKRKYTVPPAFIASPADVRRHVRAGDLRDLVYWVLWDSPLGGGPPAPHFLRIQNRPGIERVVVMLVPSLKELKVSHIDPKPVPVPSDVGGIFHEVFEYAWPIQGPQGSHPRLVEAAVSEFMRLPLSKQEKRAQERLRKAKDSPETRLTDLILTADQLSQLDYPRPGTDGYIELSPALNVDEDFESNPKSGANLNTGVISDHRESNPIESPEKSNKGLKHEDNTGNEVATREKTLHPEISPRMFAIDCEMCETASGKALTRVAVVDAEEKCVYQTLVQPPEPITDYLTAYSGITAEMLEGVTTTLTDVQQWFGTHMTSNDILVGHSLEQDLRQLRMVATRAIDTAVAYAHARGLPYRHSLKSLAQRWLHKQIQQGDGSTGHDPEEDARTCIQLVKLKLERGIMFGSQVLSTPLTQRLAEEPARVKSAIIDRVGPSRFDDAAGCASNVSCSSDSEISDRVIKMASSHGFIFGVLREHDNVDTHMGRIVEGLGRNTALIVWSGAGDNDEMLRLQAKRNEWQKQYTSENMDSISNAWTEADEEHLKRATARARTGVAFLTVLEPSSGSKKRKLD